MRSFQNDESRPRPTLGCILMASGQGRRFGGNKLLAPFRGEPLMARILSLTDTDVFSRRIVVTRHREIVELCDKAGVKAVLHDLPGRNDTVRIGLESFGENLPEGVMFCPCDQPLLSGKTLKKMALAFMEEPDLIHRLSYENTPGSPVIFPKACFPALMTLPQGKGGSYVISASPSPVRYVEASSPWELRDVDTPEDLKLLEKIINSAPT